MNAGGHPAAPPQPWLHTVRAALAREASVVRIVLAAVQGSAPREAGVCMVVGRHSIEGTIGGGRLEWDALAAARLLLDDTRRCALLKRMVLGAELGQCCGGVVDVWLERYTHADLGLLETAERAARGGAALLQSSLTSSGVERRVLWESGAATPAAEPPFGVRRPEGGPVSFTEPLNDVRPAVWLFGAGHVGRALARVLVELPLRLTWIDPRADAFPTPAPAGARILREADPIAAVAEAPAGTRYIIMTHSHPLDFGLCRAILERNDFAWLGLIGSLSKSARFRARLRRSGFPAEGVSRLTCPIGIGGIDSKWPAAIAVGVAAQLLRGLGPQPSVPETAAPAAAADASAAAIEVACAAGDCDACGVHP